MEHVAEGEQSTKSSLTENIPVASNSSKLPWTTLDNSTNAVMQEVDPRAGIAFAIGGAWALSSVGRVSADGRDAEVESFAARCCIYRACENNSVSKYSTHAGSLKSN